MSPRLVTQSQASIVGSRSEIKNIDKERENEGEKRREFKNSFFSSNRSIVRSSKKVEMTTLVILLLYSPQNSIIISSRYEIVLQYIDSNLFLIICGFSL